MKTGIEKQILDLDWLEFDNFAKEVFNKLKEKLFK